MASKFQKFLAENRIKYPPHARRDDGVYDYYHGVKVLDPYRWLEDADSDETKEFVRRQNSITTPYLMSCPERSLLNAELVKLWDHPKFSCPFKRGPSYYVFINPGMKNQSILYKQKTLYSPAKVFLDPNEFSADGTVSLSGTSFSEDGKTLAYAISVSGSDWVTIKFRNVRTGMDYPDELHNVKFSSITWTSDNRGVFYGCYIDRSTQNGKRTTAVENQRLFYHILGTSQLTDIMVVEFPQHPKWRMTAIPLDCSLYRVLLVMPCLSPNENQVYIGSLPDVIDRSIYVWPLIGKFEASYEFVTNMDTRLLFRTNKDAPNYRVIIIDLEKPSPSNWITLIHEHPRDVLDWVSPVAMDKMVCCYLQDVKHVLQIRELGTGNHIHTIHLGLGSITGFSGRHNQSEIFFAFTSFLVPGIIYKVDLAKDIWEPEVYREVKINSLKEDDYVAYQIFYESFDKTRIPMFLAHRKTLTLNGKNPTLIYGYGGFSVCSTPTFSVTRMVFMSHFNGIVAVPNLRGGGEYGELWHDAGRLKNKKNSFHDFIASAEFLIDSGHTNPSRIAVMGASNGGMLVAGATNMRPDLFGVVIAQVGVMDLLRFSNFTIGYAWASDFGDPQTNPSDFKNMYALSPLHNIQTPKNGQYPAVLLLTADHDDRVVPLHSFKFIAELQRQAISNPYQKNPLLIRVETNTGHGGGKPTHKVLEECTDILCFIALGMDIQRSTISSLPRNHPRFRRYITSSAGESLVSHRSEKRRSWSQRISPAHNGKDMHRRRHHSYNWKERGRASPSKERRRPRNESSVRRDQLRTRTTAAFGHGAKHPRPHEAGKEIEAAKSIEERSPSTNPKSKAEGSEKEEPPLIYQEDKINSFQPDRNTHPLQHLFPEAKTLSEVSQMMKEALHVQPNKSPSTQRYPEKSRPLRLDHASRSQLQDMTPTTVNMEFIDDLYRGPFSSATFVAPY